MCVARSVVVVAGCFVLATPYLVAADDAADELKKLAGRYERSFTNRAGVLFREIKEIDGDQMTVTTFDDVNNVVHAHTSTIKTEKHGPVRLLLFFNSVALAGPHKGEKQFETVPFIYRVDDDKLVEAWGLLEGGPSQAMMVTWNRIKDAK